jgi:hypothetical protein
LGSTGFCFGLSAFGIFISNTTGGYILSLLSGQWIGKPFGVKVATFNQPPCVLVLLIGQEHG